MLTYRESLRDHRGVPVSQRRSSTIWGFREPVRRSTLADANCAIGASMPSSLTADRQPDVLRQESFALDLDHHRLCAGFHDIDLRLTDIP